MSRTTTARTPAHRTPNRRWPRTALTAVSLTVALGLGACSTTATEQTAQETPATSFFDDTLVHDISVTFSDEDYQAMLATFTRVVFGAMSAAGGSVAVSEDPAAAAARVEAAIGLILTALQRLLESGAAPLGPVE